MSLNVYEESKELTHVKSLDFTIDFAQYFLDFPLASFAMDRNSQNPCLQTTTLEKKYFLRKKR